MDVVGMIPMVSDMRGLERRLDKVIPPVEGGCSFPTELCQWVDERTLMGLALEAGSETQLPQTMTSGGGVKDGANPRTLLSLLLFCYAKGLYGSQEIELAAHQDPHLRYLCVNTCPPADVLRRFRRRHRPVLEQRLAHLWGLAWGLRSERDGFSVGSGDAIRSRDSRGSSACGETIDFRGAAKWRVQQAVKTDSMALDE